MKDMFTQTEIDSLIEDIYFKKIDVYNLPKNLYNKIKDYLGSTIQKGFNIKTDLKKSKYFEQIRELEQNVYLFAGAKTFNYVLSTQNLMFENKKLIDKELFKEKAGKVFNLYNQTWLDTEYNTALQKSFESKKWVDAMSNDGVKYIEYSSVLDSETDPRCRAKDGIILPKNHPFWSKASPKTHYRCMCSILQHYDLEDLELTNESKLKNIEKNDYGFKTRPDKSIFDSTHPYFQVDNKYKKLMKNNFGLED